MWSKRVDAVTQNAGLAFLLCLFASSLSLNVALGWKVKQLSHALQPAKLKMAGIQTGSLLPSIRVVDETGRSSTVAFDDPRVTILYVWRPSCSWCRLNRGNICALALGAKSRFRFIGISIEAKGLKEYLALKPLPFPVFVVRNGNDVNKLGLDVTPQTAVVLQGGRVEKVWAGAFSKTSQRDVETFFGVKLPGLPANGG